MSQCDGNIGLTPGDDDGNPEHNLDSPRRSVRKRTLSLKGGDFFLKTGLQNRDKCHRDVRDLINVIDNLLEVGRIEEAKVKVGTLVEVHKEFVRLHMRYQDLLCQQPDVTEGEVTTTLAEEVLKMVTECTFRFNLKAPEHDKVQLDPAAQQIVCETLSQSEHDNEQKNNKRVTQRESTFENLRSAIGEVELHIANSDMERAEAAQMHVDELFDIFMSYAPDNFPELSNYVDIDKERDYTHQADNYVFAVRKRLAQFQATVHHSPLNRETLHPRHTSTLHAKPPLPEKPGSRKSGKGSQDGGSLKSHRSRSKSKVPGSNRSSSNHSNRSSRSSGSNMSERAIEEKARLAALKVESEFLEKSHKQDLEKRRLTMEADRLQIAKEIAMAEARSKVYEEHIPTSCSDKHSACSEKLRISDQVEIDKNEVYARDHTEVPVKDHNALVNKPNHQTIPSMNAKATLFEPTRGAIPPVTEKTITNSEGTCSTNMSHLNDLCRLLKIQSAPEVGMDSFSGNPLDYQYFMSLFHELVENKIDDPLGKLARLIQYTCGEAKELIQNCIQMPQPEGFNMAKELLMKEYGDPHKVTTAYMRELRSWKPIPADSVRDLKKFYRFLLKCNINRSGDVYLSLLDNPETLRSLQLKLPYRLQDRWRRKAVQYREKNAKELAFTDFLEFIRLECKVLEDPVYSQEEGGRQERDRNNIRRGHNNNNPTLRENRTETVNVSQTSESNHASVCLYCSADHDIDVCKNFLQLAYKEKRAHLYGQKICFYCYGKFSASEHGYNKCKLKRTCRTCGEFHPTALHREPKGPSQPNSEPESLEPVEESSRATHTECPQEKTGRTLGMPILPVRISHTASPETSITVYAMLDFCSTGVFLLEDTANQLGVQPHSVIVKVKTINGALDHHINCLNGLVVESLDKGARIPLPKTYIKESLPVDHNEIISVKTIEQFSYLQRVAKEIQHYPTLAEQNEIPISLIIGSNCPKAVEPIECIPSRDSGPFAYRSGLGWCAAGPTQNRQDTHDISCHRMKVTDVSTGGNVQHEFTIKNHLQDTSITEQLVEMYTHDFNENSSEKKSLSVEDKRFLEIMQNGEKKVGNHHQLPLPLRNAEPMLPDNYTMARKRLVSVKKRIERDELYRENYVKFMSNLISCGYARKADTSKKIPQGMKWLTPHHGVYHPKTGKFRVVMDCSAVFQGRSLNAELLQGPDNTNLLLGVLLRFRLNSVPIMGDLEQMFYQIQVPEEQRSLLRFLWWPDGDTSQEPLEHEMCVHLFGAISSPSVAGYALRKTADDGAIKHGEVARDTILKNFYVDDLAKSNETTEETISMINNVSNMCASGGFNLTKIISSSRKVLESIPIEKRGKNFQACDISGISNLPIERALGVIWDVENDTLGFRIQLSSKPLSRRVILADVSSAYDPDGRGSAFILPGKKILQEITAEKKGWDEPVSEVHATQWNNWKRQIITLEKMMVPRCYTPKDFGETTSRSLHCLSDASTAGYGQASYLRSVNAKGEVHVALAMAKSRVAPLKSITIPRLELTAATVSVKVAALLREELAELAYDTYFWTDSTIVLGYIRNETKRFRTYVANRIQTIHSYSTQNQWRHVPTEHNPADFASRGICPTATEKVNMWFNGPDFLWKEESAWPVNVNAIVEEDDEEVKPTTLAINKIVVSEDFDLLTTLETQCSSWHRLVRRMAVINKFIISTRGQIQKRKKQVVGKVNTPTKSSLTAKDIKVAENLVIKLSQRKYMQKEIDFLQKTQKTESTNKRTNKKMRNRSSLAKLNPFINSDGLICIGGRLRKSSLDSQTKHPLVVPKKSPASTLLIRQAHERVAHGGRGTTMNRLRQDGLWVIGAHSGVRSCIDKCRTCRELRGKLSQQKMADLPTERVQPSPPFTHCGADMFGPFIIKEGRKELKRYGCIFTCMSSRAVHIETTSQMCADTLIQALRRFIARRGQVSTIRTDNGTNFVGAENELRKCLDEMDHEKIQKFLLTKGCDWITWERNPPSSSHMGGVWERQIRSIRTILSALMKQHAAILNDESLRTLMTETEAIINSRPLTVDTMSDPTSPLPLSPIQLLTFKSDVVFPPPGDFQRCDLYCRKHWRRVQYLANQFWHRWRVEYLATLQPRQKWTTKSRNYAVGDVVLVKDDDIFTNRNGWPMALVTEVFTSEDEMVRQVRLRVASKQPDKTRSLLRPITKLVLLVPVEDVKDVKAL